VILYHAAIQGGHVQSNSCCCSTCSVRQFCTVQRGQCTLSPLVTVTSLPPCFLCSPSLTGCVGFPPPLCLSLPQTPLPPRPPPPHPHPPTHPPTPPPHTNTHHTHTHTYTPTPHLYEADSKGIRLDLANKLLADTADKLMGGAEYEYVGIRNLHEAHNTQHKRSFMLLSSAHAH